jgi:hypothetical protein
MFKQGNARRADHRVIGAITIVFAALLGSLALAGPANAVTTRSYHNMDGSSSATLRPSSNSSNAHAKVSAGLTNGYWEIQQITDSPSGHDRVFLKSTSATGRCLDSHGSTNGGDAWVHSCNGGDYQIWEVFYRDNSTRVFKSWGAYTQQSLHLCLALADNGHAVMKTCNVDHGDQQWY